jgi:hypothetical protein
LEQLKRGVPVAIWICFTWLSSGVGEAHSSCSSRSCLASG